MSNILWWVPLTAGFQDGLNPCILMTAAMVLLSVIWLKRNKISQFWILLLIAVVVVNSFIINCGWLDPIILSKSFQIVVQILYVFLGVVAAIAGLKYVCRWYFLVKNKEAKPQVNQFKKRSAGELLLLTYLIGTLLSFLASLWPVNYYISFFSVYMTMPDQWFTVGFMIFLYTFVSLWIVYLAVWTLVLEKRNQRLFSIITAAILLAASLGVMDMVFRKG